MIYLRKSQSICLSILAVVAFFVVCFLLLEHKPKRPQPDLDLFLREQAQTAEQVSQIITVTDSVQPSVAQGNPLFTLNNFERSELRDGQKVWEIKAVKGQYFPENSSAKLEGAEITLYKKSGDEKSGAPIVIKAAKAIVDLTGATLLKAEAFNGVQIRIGEELSASMETAVYLGAEGRVYSPGPVTIVNSRLEVTGREFYAYLKDEYCEFKQEVSSIVKASEEVKEKR